MESRLSQLYNKKEKERQKGEEGGKQGTKIMVFLEVKANIDQARFTKGS